MNTDTITSEEDLSRNNVSKNPVMDNVENSEQTATNPTPTRKFNVFDELSGFHTHEGQLNEGIQDALDLEKEYYTPQAGWGESSYDKEVKNKYQIEQGDLNDIRAEQQAGGTQVLNGFGKALVLTGTTMIDGTIGTIVGLGKGIANASSDDPNATFWSGFYDNGVSSALRDVEKWFDKVMPNYVSTSESQLGMFASMGTANFWGEQIKQMGFTIGTALGATITGLATGGAGLAPKLAGSLAKVLGAGARGVNLAERTALAVMSGFNETKNVVSGGLENRFNTYNKDNFNDYQQKLKNLDDRITAETYKRMVDLGYFKGHGEGTPTVIPNQEVIDQYKALVAKEFQGEYDAIKAEYENKSKDPMQRTIAASSLELGVGTAFMTAMNMIGQGAVLPSPFVNAERMVQGSITNKFARIANAVTGRNKFSKNAFNEFKAISAPELAVRKTLSGVSEMVEEGGQDIVTDFANAYYSLDNVNSGKNALARAMDSFLSAVDKNIHGDAMYRDMQAAFLSTLIGTPIVNKGASQNGKKDRTFTWQGGVVQMFKDAKEESRKSKETYDFIRNIINSPERKAAFNLNVYANSQKEKMMEAASTADEKKWRDSADNIALKAIESFASIGRLSDLKALTSDYENISDEELEGLAIGLSKRNEDGTYVSENGAVDENGELITSTKEGREKFKADLIANSKKFNKMIDNWTKNFNETDKLTGYQLNRDDLSMVTWGLTQANNWDERIKSMSKNIKDNYSKPLDIIINKLQSELDDKNKAEQELNELIAQDKDNPSETLKKQIEAVKSQIDEEVESELYSSVINMFKKLQSIDLEGNEKGLWNQFGDDNLSMYTSAQGILQDISEDELSLSDKSNFLNLLDDIRKCNNSRHNVLNVVNQLIKNPETAKKLRDSFISKEDNINIDQAVQNAENILQYLKEENGNIPTDQLEEVLNKLFEELEDPSKIEEAVKRIANKNPNAKNLFQMFQDKMKEMQAINNVNNGNQLQNDRLPAVVNNSDNRQFIENCIKSLLDYLKNKYKNKKKSIYRLSIRDIANDFWEMLHQPTETSIIGVRTQESIATPYGVPNNNELYQRLPSDTEFQIVVSKVKEIIRDLYKNAVENGDINKKSGVSQFTVDDNGNVYVINNNKPVKVENVKPIQIETRETQDESAKTQSGIVTTTSVEVPIIDDREIIDVEYEIVYEVETVQDEEEAASLGEYVETLDYTDYEVVVTEELDSNSNTLPISSEIIPVTEEQLDNIEEEIQSLNKSLPEAPKQLVLLEKNQEDERAKLGEVLSKIFQQETSKKDEISRLLDNINKVLNEKEQIQNQLNDIQTDNNSTKISTPEQLKDIQTKTEELKKQLQDKIKEEEELKKQVETIQNTDTKVTIEDDNIEYVSILTNVSSLKYEYNPSIVNPKESLTNPQALQFLREKGAYEFVNSGKLASLVNSRSAITPVYFKREEGIENTVFMYVKNSKAEGGYQCIGFIDNAGMQGVLGYNILYPNKQKSNGFYYDINGQKHSENIAIVDNEGYSNPTNTTEFKMLKNIDGKILSIGTIFNGNVYRKDTSSPISDINVGNMSFDEAFSKGLIHYGYVSTKGIHDIQTQEDIPDVYNYPLGTTVVIFTSSDGTKRGFSILTNSPITTWSVKAKNKEDKFIESANNALMGFASSISNKSDHKTIWKNMVDLFRHFSHPEFNPLSNDSYKVRYYADYTNSPLESVRGKIFSRRNPKEANLFIITLQSPITKKPVTSIVINTDDLLNKAKQEALNKGIDPNNINLDRLVARLIYNQLMNPKVVSYNEETNEWTTSNAENLLNFRYNSHTDTKLLSSMSNYFSSDALNFETSDSTFTVMFQTNKDRAKKINLSSFREGSVEKQRASQLQYPSIKLNYANKQVDFTIVPENAEDGGYDNSFVLKRTDAPNTSIGYYGKILNKKLFIDSLGLTSVAENKSDTSINDYANVILSCLYHYNSTISNELPIIYKYTVNNNIMNIEDLGISIDLSTMKYVDNSKQQNEVQTEITKTEETNVTKQETNQEETTETNQETNQEVKSTPEPKKVTTFTKKLNNISKKGFGSLGSKKFKRKGVSRGLGIYAKTGKYNAKKFLNDNIQTWKSIGVDSQLLDFIASNLSDDTTITILSDQEFTDKHGENTLGVYVVSENKVELRSSNKSDTAIHELAHAVTISLTNAWLQNKDVISGKIDSPISTLMEIIDEVKELYANNPSLFKNTNIEYVLNQTNAHSQIDEFIAELFGDANFQQILKGQSRYNKDNTKSKSILDKIIDFLKDLFRRAGANYHQVDNMISLFDEFKTTVSELNKIKPLKNTDNEFNFSIDQTELQEIKEKAIANGTFMKAPNGKPSNLNERQWLQVRTKAFKEWFGDWENDPANASKVVDSNKEPLVVWHGTYNKFNTFDTNKKRYDVHNKGIFFTETEKNAKKYGSIQLPVFLNLRNPSYSEFDGNLTLSQLREKENNIIKNADDGAIINTYDKEGKGLQYIVFDPNQVKSATDNNGNYSTTDNNIYKREISNQSNKLNEDLIKFFKSLNITLNKVDLNNQKQFDIISKIVNYTNTEDLLNYAVDVLVDLTDKYKFLKLLEKDPKFNASKYGNRLGLVRNVIFKDNYKDLLKEDIDILKSDIKKYIIDKYKNENNKHSKIINYILKFIDNIKNFFKSNPFYNYLENMNLYEMFNSGDAKEYFTEWISPYKQEVKKIINSTITRMDVPKLLNTNKFASDLIQTLNSDGFILGGSIAIAAEGFLARKGDISLHDLDIVTTKKMSIEDKSNYLKDNKSKFEKLGFYYAQKDNGNFGVIVNNNLTAIPFLNVPVDYYTVDGVGENKVMSFYKDGELVCKYQNDKVVEGNAEVTLVDILDAVEMTQPVIHTFNNKQYTFSSFKGAMQFKVDKRRAKDIADWINFVKDTKYSESIVNNYCTQNNISKQYFDKLPAQVQDLVLQCY